MIEDVEALPPNDVSRLFRFLERSPGNCKAIVTSRMRFDGSAIYIRAEGLSTVDAMAMMQDLARTNPAIAKASHEELQRFVTTARGNPALIRWTAELLGREGGPFASLQEAAGLLRAERETGMRSRSSGAKCWRRRANGK